VVDFQKSLILAEKVVKFEPSAVPGFRVRITLTCGASDGNQNSGDDADDLKKEAKFTV